MNKLLLTLIIAFTVLLSGADKLFSQHYENLAAQASNDRDNSAWVTFENASFDYDIASSSEPHILAENVYSDYVFVVEQPILLQQTAFNIRAPPFRFI
ncbi:hypothetical protein [Glaciecola sp. SC05]|uniref:hypothetical protein n=1 Tax=Glaciecola sp. SC05 TaxID=1987355 RepID=UPI0035297530